ncbi:MAG: peptidyl-prolyl cis-trans isomerase cpr6 [Geoglossum simile]|nr:MAG: peptidyl-prolyl cis-trans isomerase cpr6 [Geoglossum simile]
MSQDGIRAKLATPQDYISWVEDWLTYRGQIGLKTWELLPQDIADLMPIQDSEDGELETGYLDLNSCLGSAVRDAERDKYIQTLILNHRNLAPRAAKILDNRIDYEISDPAIVEDLKRADAKLADKIIGLSRNKLLPPGYTVHLLNSRPKEGKLLSGLNNRIRTFQIPVNTSFENFVAKLYSESLIFWPKGPGVNRGYNLENSSWTYCLLSDDNRVSPKTRKITGKSDYLSLLKHLSQDDTSPSPSSGKMTEVVAGPLHSEPLHGVTREEHNRLVNMHPVHIVDNAIELKDRGSRAYLSGDLALGLQEYKRGLVFIDYLTKHPSGMQRLCNQARATLSLNCALVHLELGCFEEAIACSLQALKVPDLTAGQLATAYYRCGTGRAGLQDSPRAIEDLVKAFEFSPHDGQILEMLGTVEKSLPENADPSIRKKYEAIRDSTSADFPEGSQDKPYESVLSPCEIQAIDKSKRVLRGSAGPPPKELNTEKFTPSSGPGTPLKKGNLGLPDDFWDDWTSDVDGNGEPLDRYGNPFFDPYDPQAIIRAILKDPSFP